MKSGLPSILLMDLYIILAPCGFTCSKILAYDPSKYQMFAIISLRLKFKIFRHTKESANSMNFQLFHKFTDILCKLNKFISSYGKVIERRTSTGCQLCRLADGVPTLQFQRHFTESGIESDTLVWHSWHIYLKLLCIDIAQRTFKYHKSRFSFKEQSLNGSVLTSVNDVLALKWSVAAIKAFSCKACICKCFI